MPRWLTRSFWFAAIIGVLLAGAYYWFIGDGNPPGNVEAFALDMAKVRELATIGPPEARAVEVRVETIGVGTFPQALIEGGGGWGGFRLGMLSYQILFPDLTTVIIDTALSEEAGAGFGLTFDSAAYDRMIAGMTRASQILLTHEHSDHIGGILAHPDQAAIAPRLRLTTDQLRSAPGFNGLTVFPEALRDAKPVSYDDYLAVAPGVVLIKAPGHSPGSQIIFVMTLSGREYLFVGDVGWGLQNIENLRGRPRLVSQLLLKNEDRDAVFGQLVSVKALHAADPALVIVPGHDATEVERLIADGALIAGFL